VVTPNYYLDPDVVDIRGDELLWEMATENGDPIFVRDEASLRAQLERVAQLGPIGEDERDIDVLRVL
jgi:hypothetical protein